METERQKRIQLIKFFAPARLKMKATPAEDGLGEDDDVERDAGCCYTTERNRILLFHTVISNDCAAINDPTW